MTTYHLRRIVRAALAAGLAVVVVPTPAEAHLVTTGLGPVFDGIGHLFLTPEDMLPALGLALFAGLRGASAGRAALFALPAAWLLGGVIGLASGVSASSWTTVVSILVCGGLVAGDVALPAHWVPRLAVVLGLLHGSMNGQAMAHGRMPLLGLVGVAAALFVLVALAAALVVSLRRPWTRIAVRVAGSWIVATGLLLLGWWFRSTA